MLARWQARRRETLAAVEAALAEGGMLAVVTGGAPTAAHPTRDELIRLTHQFAGTAGLFGEDELGRCAAALERSLQDEASPAVSRALAQELVALAEGAGQAGAPQPADSANG
jgi:HPt (histidine-containing phosphotransfer) domain-containing protein